VGSAGTESPEIARVSWLPFAAAAGAAVLATLAVGLLAPLRFAYHAPSLRVALDTGGALIGLVATAIVVRGCRDALRLDRLAVAAGLAVLALVNGVLTALLTVAPGFGPRATIAVTGTLVAAVLLVAGAVLPMRRPRAPRAAALWMAGVTVGALAVAAGPVALVMAQRGGAADPGGPLLAEPPAEAALILVTALCFAVAAVGLTHRGVVGRDAFSRRLGLAVLFLAFAKLDYALLPPVTHEWVHLGDVLRLLFCVVLLWAAVAEVTGAVAARAAERERRRIALELHDGVAQELAFIRRRAAQRDAHDIVVAADRALLDSRCAIERFARAPGEPLERVLARHAAVIGARTDVAVTFSTSGSAAVSAEVSEALLRIVGEAVANARHGGARRVHVDLSVDPLRLRVVDDGAGFDPAAAAGFGLGGMRERAALVGAELSVRSGPGAGTEVAVELR
jgi:signal transduction histidine kinase